MSLCEHATPTVETSPSKSPDYRWRQCCTYRFSGEVAATPGIKEVRTPQTRIYTQITNNAS